MCNRGGCQFIIGTIFTTFDLSDDKLSPQKKCEMNQIVMY